MGYHRAGFDVVGVDIRPQPRYPFEFHIGDAMEWPLGGFDVVHASPPCQDYSQCKAMHPERVWSRLVDPIRARLQVSPIYIIENVPGSPLHNPIVLCGTAFGLGAKEGELRRHRLFESSVLLSTPGCAHSKRTVGVYGHGVCSSKWRMLNKSQAQEALGITWMNRDEMAQSIPPAYTEFIGKQLMACLERAGK